ncbi:MAG: helix-turn-helix domain-containing protein [Pyrinomonadaceae bacterium]|nr:helix-turn-helix domain-containing protein [Pyrinomonadaceae bacterium]
MSLTLGEKLRQAREAQGVSIREVAEQTRISALYLECIENDDYRTLPGGIFNKGFVKSFAKIVGVDEQEALQDYAALVTTQGVPVAETPKTYRSEVLTDDRSAASSLPTIIIAVVILGLMTAGILAFLNYYNKESVPTANTANSNANANAATNINLANANTAPTSNAPTMNNLKVEFKALNSPVSLTSTIDGKKSSGNVTPDAPRILEPKQSLRLSFAKAQTQNVAMTVNGKAITLPTGSANRNAVDFEINAENLKQIWDSGQIISAAPAAPPPPR